MSNPRVPILPFDIIEEIVDILINNRTKGLQCVKDFSLVCQSFLPLCRKHIFSSVSIKISSPESLDIYNGEAFGRLLLERPGIAICVYKLKICIEQPDSESKYFLEQVSRQLTRLQSLTISHSMHGNQMYWHNISSSTQSSLLNLMHLPTLTHLDIRCITSFPKSGLIACTNVKHFCAHRLYIRDDEAQSSPSHKPLKLQSFNVLLRFPRSLILLEAMCSDGRPVLDFTDLEKIYIDFEWVDGTIIKNILKKCQQLRDISLRIDGM